MSALEKQESPDSQRPENKYSPGNPTFTVDAARIYSFCGIGVRYKETVDTGEVTYTLEVKAGYDGSCLDTVRNYLERGLGLNSEDEQKPREEETEGWARIGVWSHKVRDSYWEETLEFCPPHQGYFESISEVREKLAGKTPI